MPATMLLVGLLAAQPADNPNYATWAKSKPGTTVVLRTVSETAGNKSESTLTQKLVELTADKAVVEVSTLTKAAGREIKTPPTRLEHPRTVPPAAGTPPTAAVPKPQIETGDETITVGGKSYNCKRTKSTIVTGGLTVESTAWTTEEVPGMVVKSVSKTSGPVSTTSTLELVEIKLP